jgi:hypothetical protein
MDSRSQTPHGPCEGTLVANNRDFMSPRTEHAFSARSVARAVRIGLSRRALKVKVRKERGFCFTEKSGSADALFVFHKNVQAFREKM